MVINYRLSISARCFIATVLGFIILQEKLEIQAIVVVALTILASMLVSQINWVLLLLDRLDYVELMEANIITTTEYYELIKDYIAGIRLEQANLNQAIFIGFQRGRCCTYLKGVDFRQAILSDISFECAELLGANFSDLNLNSVNSVNFREAKLTGANFSNCSLRGANFFRAVLHGVNFKGADLSGVTLQEYQIKDAIMPDDFDLKQNG